jgi:hypothetical protein
MKFLSFSKKISLYYLNELTTVFVHVFLATLFSSRRNIRHYISGVAS